MPLQFRRGTNAERLTITPAVGEPIWTTNTNLLYVGDGTTVGGIRIELPLPSTATFATLTVTNLHFSGDPVGVDQTTAYTGTVAWSAINSKPNNGLYTTSSVEFNQLEVNNSTFANTSSAVLINASGSTTYEPPHSSGYNLWMISKPTAAARLVADTYGTSGSVWTGRRARGTAAAPTAAQATDLLLRIAGTGYGTTEFENTSSAYIDITALENFTDGAHGTKFSFVTTNVGSNDQTTALSVSSTGSVFVAKNVPATNSAVVINSSGATTWPTPPGGGTMVHAISTDSGASRIIVDNYSTTPLSIFQGRGARGTPSAPTASQDGDILVSLRGQGYGTTGFATTSAAFLNILATENFTDSARGAKFQFYANPDGSITPNLLATIRDTGVFAYSTGSQAVGTGMINAIGTGPELARPGAEFDTLFHGVALPGAAGRITLDAYGATDPSFTPVGAFTGRRALGTSDAPSAVTAGMSLARFNTRGYGTTGFIGTSSAIIDLVAAENFTDSAAGGKIEFIVQQVGSVSTSTQLQIATIDQTGLTIDYGGLTSTNITVDNLYGGSGGNIQSYANISPNGTRNLGSLSAKWSNVWASTVNTTNLTFADATNQTTAWTGSVSTSSVTGLATVAWTGKYSDLIGGPNQALDTTSAVQFAGITDTGNLSVTGFSSLNGGSTISALTVTNAATVGTTLGVTGYTSLNGGATISAATVTNNLTAGATTLQSVVVTTGTQLTKTLSVGGIPLNAAGTSSFSLATVNSPTLIVSNTTPGQNAQILVRAFGQNNPNGISTTNPNNALRLETAFGTAASPTTVTAQQNLGGIIIQGYDGRNWPADYNQSVNFLGWFATETMTNDGSTSTLAAGSGFNIYTQPAWTKVGVNQTRQRFLITNWSTSTTAPSINQILMGAGLDTNTTTNVVLLNGNTYVGPGRANMQFINSNVYQVGVPFQDSAPDNTTLPATNIYTFVAGRRSGVSGRRDIIQSGDNLGGFNWNGQTANNGTQFGSQSAVFVCDALETFSASARGSRLRMQTTNTGTNILSTRFALSDQWNQYSSALHTFYNTATNYRFMDISTSTIQCYVPVQFPTYTAATKPATGSVGQQICITDSASGSNPNGMMAFWDTTNARWSYIQIGRAHV